MGAQQTGIVPMKYTNLVRDSQYLMETKKVAELICNEEPELSQSVDRKMDLRLYSFCRRIACYIRNKKPAVAGFLFFILSNFYNIPFNVNKGAMTKLTIAITLIKMFIEGPEVSLKGSPTVSPTTTAA